jgi:acid phosphatase family membrane protein YuiD
MGILSIFKNDVLMVALSAWLTAQVIKIIINAIVNKTFALERLFGDGGMPSGHSATVVAAAMMVGLHEGLTSPVFGLALVIAIIVMHDATGVRQEAGKHAKSIIEIVDILHTYIDFCQERNLKEKTEKFKTLIGHTHLQVLFGAITGICVVLIYLVITDNWCLLSQCV